MSAIRWSYEDAYFYIALASSLVAGRWELLGEFHTKYLPGYPAAIAFVHSFFFGAVDWFRSAQLVSALASSLLPPLCYLVVRDLTARSDAAWSAALMALFNAQLMVKAGLPWSESLFSFQVLLTFVLLPRTPLLAGLIVGWAAITRHEGWFLLPAMALLFFDSSSPPRRRHLLVGLTFAFVLPALWWLLAYHETGRWLFEIYTQEESERRLSMPRVGASFFLLAFPTAGHLVSLLAVPGVAGMILSSRGWPLLVFFFAYAAFHGWWLFPDERYFVPLIPLVCVMAGVGLARVISSGKEKEKENLPSFSRPTFSRWRLLLPGLGLLAGGSHLGGFAPALLREEVSRTEGYFQAVLWLRERPGDFSIIAYEALMVGYYTGRTVIPSGMMDSASWMPTVPRLYFQYNTRYILWSDFYPADREKEDLSAPQPLWISGPMERGGEKFRVLLDAVPEKVFPWKYYLPASPWFLPWRRQKIGEREAIIFRLEFLEAQPQ